MNDLKKYLEDNIKFEESWLKKSSELSDQIHRGANLSTFRRVLKFLEVHDATSREKEGQD